MIAVISFLPVSTIAYDFACFSPTLYVGEDKEILYALPALVDEDTVTIAVSNTMSHHDVISHANNDN